MTSNDLSNALAHHRAGRLDCAEKLYRKILKKTPDNPDALHLLGVAAAARGHNPQAITLIGRALALAPGSATMHANLGNALRAAGRPAEAVERYRSAIALQPDFAAAHCNLGLALADLGDFAAAAACCAHALTIDPGAADIHGNLGAILRRAGAPDAAEASLRRAMALDPDSLAPTLALADLLLEGRRFAEAAAYSRRAVAIDSRSPGAHRHLGTSLRGLGDIEPAVASFQDALALSPNEAAVWNDLGRCHLAQGRLEAAAAAFRRAIAIDPDLADAYRNLAACRLLPADDPAMRRLSALAENPGTPAEAAAAAGFALGKALDDSGRHDEAFAAYHAANRIYRAAAGNRFDAAAFAAHIEKLIATFTPDFFAGTAAWGNPSETPVFIVGPPRSGTSLVEQIAASHDAVFGAGELTAIGDIAAALGPPGQGWTPSAVRAHADAHLAQLTERGANASRIIDKLPDNIFMLGLIATLYPRARVIICRRDPRDTGLSCYFQKFAAGLMIFSYDLADCGVRLAQTERLAEHWRRSLPLRWLDVDYESLVADPQAESRRLIAFLGLAWQPACLDFHRTSRTVQTASSWQVRQPLYHQSVGRWRRYERHLAPLLDTLGPRLL